MTQESAIHNCDVIVVNYNAGALLAACVQSALAENARKVIIVDNGSQDDSLALVEKVQDPERIQVIRNGNNLGFSAACNIGATVSNASTLLFLNPDSVLAPGTLQRMIEVLESDPGIGMVGGMLRNPDGTEQPGGRRQFPTPKQAFVRAFGLSRLARWFPNLFADFSLHEHPLPTQPVAVEAISGACMLVKRKALQEVGLWDEGYFLHCEDLDWCMRFHLKGWQVVFVPDAPVIHEWGACSGKRPFFVEWHKHRGMLRFYQKFFRNQYSTLLWWLVVQGVWLRFGLVCAYHAGKQTLNRLGGAQ